MLRNQMDRIEQMVGQQSLMSQNLWLAKIMEERGRKEKKFDNWLQEIINKNK